MDKWADLVQDHFALSVYTSDVSTELERGSICMVMSFLLAKFFHVMVNWSGCLGSSSLHCGWTFPSRCQTGVDLGEVPWVHVPQTVMPAGKGAHWDEEQLKHDQEAEWEPRSTQQVDLGCKSRWEPRSTPPWRPVQSGAQVFPPV